MAAATCVPSAFLSTSLKNTTCSISHAHHSVFTCFAAKKNNNKLSFMDQILDYIEGGPKLRKWYGAPDILPKDASNLEDEDIISEEGEVRDAVLVTDGDNEIGQMVILSLIIKRSRVKALVKNKRAAVESFGTYVESMAGDTTDKKFQKKALRGVRAIICPNVCISDLSLYYSLLIVFTCQSPILVYAIMETIIIMHIVFSCIALIYLNPYKKPNYHKIWKQSYILGRFPIQCRKFERGPTRNPLIPGSSGIQAIMNSNSKKMAAQDETVITNSGIPYTIIRTGSLTNTPGGKLGFNFKEGSAAQGTLSKEDAAFICVEALDTVPKQGLIFEVVNGEEKVMNWKDCFAELIEKTE